MNEIIFASHSLFITGCALGALYLGKEALITFIASLAILSNIFVTKQIVLFGYQATPTDALTIGLVISLNLLQEYYGKEITKKAIGISFLISIVYTFLSQFHLLYLPGIHDTTQHHASALFGIMPRIILASLFTYFVVQRIDCLIYGFLKKKFNNNYLIARNYASLVFSQLIDTVLFSFLGLYGTIDSIVPVIIVSYGIKLILIMIMTPFLRFSKKINRIKSYEHISL